MTKYDLSIREEELKNLVRDDWFGKYDGNKIIGNIDLSVCVPTDPGQLELFDLDFFLWAEAKKGNKEDIDDSLVQLIITIMKARTYNDYLPPLYLAAFDAEKIAFIPYDDKLQRQVIFDPILENNIDWTTITPSDHSSKAFDDVKKKAKDILSGKIQFDFIKEEKLLKQFIKSNFVVAKTGTNKINITLNRMTSIFNRWLEIVKPTIKITWKEWEKANIYPADFFLADAISKNNQSLGESLQVLLRSNAYQVKIPTDFGIALRPVEFTDKQKAHKTFWNKYNRPPRRKERLLMQERRDLLIEPDRRESSGAFYTPPQWVDLSREYLNGVLGENWQNEYYVWDCCAGTGNLVYGLTEKERIFASTKDDPDVTYMKTRDNLLPMHVFQFDFLNDDLFGDKVPEDLKRILKDPEERKKLVIYINPPYAEAASTTTLTRGNKNKKNVATNNKTYDKYKKIIGAAANEVFAQFFIRIYKEIPGAILAEFSKLKILQASNFADFRKVFRAKLEKAFIVPANTFDNVPGKFPIGFFIWDTNKDCIFSEINSEVYTYEKKRKEVKFDGYKFFANIDGHLFINKWYSEYYSNSKEVGVMNTRGNDFQNQNYIRITSENNKNHTNIITASNIIPSCIYLSVRHCIEADWLNDRDQFLYPRKAWKEDHEFQNDCLAFTLFHGQNRITSAEGINHWIPFAEKEVSAPMLFESHFMSDFIAGKIKQDTQQTLFGDEESLIPTEPIQFSPEAQTVMDAGRELWSYYMAQKDELKFNVNASYYDIRFYFQGKNNKGNMSSDSKDEKYKRILNKIKEAQKVLAEKIRKKVYLYGFLLDETTLPEDEHEEIVEPPTKEPVKKARKTLPKPKAQTVVHYHIDHVDTINLGDNVENKFS